MLSCLLKMVPPFTICFDHDPFSQYPTDIRIRFWHAGETSIFGP